MVNKDLYEVLGIAADADESTIKTAYRKLALRWHPDKNQDNLEHAEEQFKEIQNAYEILSDAHERAWYDSHKDAILRSGERHQAGGGGGFEGRQRPEDEPDLYAYFTASCYSGFGDGPRGFYGVYDELFQRLAKQEAEAHKRRSDRKGKRPPGPFPRFGFSSAPWEEVAAFYAQWGGFATAKDFSWADQYNPASAPNRRVRRAMEQENEKARRGEKREYNEAVRELVGFLHKRDKRVAARQVEEARRREEREREERARREREQAERAARLREYREAEWLQAGSEEGSSEESEDEADMLVWYCAACEKHFKSEPAFENHQRSKKHLENVELLRAALEEDELAAGGLGSEGAGGPAGGAPHTAAASSSNSSSSTTEGTSESRGSEVESDEEAKGSAAGQRKSRPPPAAAAKGRRGAYQRMASGGRGDAPASPSIASSSSSSSLCSGAGSESEAESEDLDEDSLLERLVATRRGGSRAEAASRSPSASSSSSGDQGSPGGQQKGGGRGGGEASSRESSDGEEGSEQEGEEEEEEEEEDAMLQRMMAASRGPGNGGRAQRGRQRHDAGHPAGPVGSREADAAAAELEKMQLGGEEQGGNDGTSEDEGWGHRRGPRQKGGRGKQQQQQRAQAGAAAAAAPDAKLTAKQKRQQRQAAKAGAGAGTGAGEGGELACSVCGSTFESRNQLFKHIQATGHAALRHG